MLYENAKIYRIFSKKTGLNYYGSTCATLQQRLNRHRHQMKRYVSGAHAFTSSFEVLIHKDAKIELVELFPCETKPELNIREGEIIRANECVNRNIPGRTRKQYLIDNKEKLQKKKKEYRKNNREALIKKKKEYDIRVRVNCECGGRYRNEPKEKRIHFNSKRHLKSI